VSPPVLQILNGSLNLLVTGCVCKTESSDVQRNCGGNTCHYANKLDSACVATCPAVCHIFTSKTTYTCTLVTPVARRLLRAARGDWVVYITNATHLVIFLELLEKAPPRRVIVRPLRHAHRPSLLVPEPNLVQVVLERHACHVHTLLRCAPSLIL
jgi:hypothetical protein